MIRRDCPPPPRLRTWCRRLGALTLVAPLAMVGAAACGSDQGGEGGDDDSNLTGPEPNAEYCDEVAEWDEELETWEFEVLDLVNQRRSEGANCGSAGSFGPADPLIMQTQLRCAARAHSLDMAQRGFFDHTNPDGDGPEQRIAATGYQPAAWGENIAGGYPDPAAVMDGWMDSDGHCSNIMSPNFTQLGVGAYTEGSPLWTQVFGAPAS